MYQQQRDQQEAYRVDLRQKAVKLRQIAGKERSEDAETWAINTLSWQADHPDLPKDKEAEAALAEFQAAVNAYWLLAENQGVTQVVARAWFMARHKTNPSLSADETGAEATFAMRHIIIQHADSPRVMPLVLFARDRMQLALDRWLADDKGLPVGPKDKDKVAAAVGHTHRDDAYALADILPADGNPEEALLAFERDGINIFGKE